LTGLLAGMASLGVLGALTLGARHRPRLLLPGLGLIALSFGLIILIARTRGFAPLKAHVFTSAGAHYVYVALLIALTGVFSLVSVQTDRVRRVAVIMIVVQFGVIAGFAFRMPNARSDQRSWATVVAEARLACNNHRSRTVVVPLAPALPWSMRVPCNRL
jgi:hypothetical protein